ncbi:MAG: hypothetical protein KatS3mg060_0434 [Dehalococcoidia bacterium]|nr:MAG: hypothetical protein KatS3mg060_0434 [Dehalococcoidia bacterium]
MSFFVITVEMLFFQKMIKMTPRYRNLTFTGNGMNAVVIEGGNLDSPVTLDGSQQAMNGPFVLSNSITIYNGGTLTITPGTTLRFGTTAWLLVGSASELIAEGTASQPINIHGRRVKPGAWRMALHSV